jgi:hypothetical protein
MTVGLSACLAGKPNICLCAVIEVLKRTNVNREGLLKRVAKRKQLLGYR